MAVSENHRNRSLVSSMASQPHLFYVRHLWSLNLMLGSVLAVVLIVNTKSSIKFPSVWNSTLHSLINGYRKRIQPVDGRLE